MNAAPYAAADNPDFWEKGACVVDRRNLRRGGVITGTGTEAFTGELRVMVQWDDAVRPSATLPRDVVHTD